MFRLRGLAFLGCLAVLAVSARAQYTGGATGTSAPAASNVFGKNYHISFERPEAWGMKYFASVSLLSGLPVPPSNEGNHFGSFSVGIETDWLPQLDAGQQHIGFSGTVPEALNHAPILARPVVRVGLPAKFSALVAAPPPLELWGVRPHLIEFGLERPLFERNHWAAGWRGYGQVGSVRGAFTCPSGVLGFTPGSAGNPTRCVGVSADRATLDYAGMELQVSYRIPSAPKIIPHAAVGGNFLNTVFQTHAPVVAGMDETRLWTRGGTFDTSGGITYRFTDQIAFTVDAFYSPLWVTRNPRSANPVRTNDGLLNVRAFLSYTFR